MKKLTKEQRIILTAVSDSTIERDGMSLYWVPSRDYERLSTGESFKAGGSGDASSLKYLERQGYIEHPEGAPRNTMKFSYRITQKGRDTLKAAIPDVYNCDKCTAEVPFYESRVTDRGARLCTACFEQHYYGDDGCK